MIDKPILDRLAVKLQTTTANVRREYVQNLFLRSFYTKTGCEDFLFKGGTALRIVFGSPRFSEDLDFSGFADDKAYERVLEGVVYDLSCEGFGVDIEESKTTSGGYLANIVVEFGKEKIWIKNQISFRKKTEKKLENRLIISDVIPAYNISVLDLEYLTGEKVQALIERAKPRDFFDLHFMLINPEFRHGLKIGQNDREKILEKVDIQDKLTLERELKMFLPKSFWGFVKDLPAVLKKDLG